MKLKDMYIKTYKECPIEADYNSMKLLYRSGFLKYNESSNYSYTPIGSLFLNKLVKYLNNSICNYLDIVANNEDILDLYINDPSISKFVTVLINECLKLVISNFFSKIKLINPIINKKYAKTKIKINKFFLKIQSNVKFQKFLK
jgi:prolyl-tRNA synthetase